MKNNTIYKNKIACIIVNYNDCYRTLQLVEKIKNYCSITHIIIVDNMSTDNSSDILKTLSDEKTIFIQAPKNGGYGYGNNLGILKANELNDSYALIANPDVVFENECVEKMLIFISSHSECAIVGAKEEYLGVSGWKYTSDFQDVLSSTMLMNKLLKKRYYEKDYFDKPNFVSVDVIPGCFLMVNLDYMMKYGMYDEDFFLFEEEKVLYKKMSDNNLKSFVVTEASYEHRHIKTNDYSLKKMLKMKKYLLMSKFLFFKKYRLFNFFKLFLSNCIFLLAYIEMFFYGLFRIIFRNKKKNC